MWTSLCATTGLPSRLASPFSTQKTRYWLWSATETVQASELCYHSSAPTYSQCLLPGGWCLWNCSRFFEWNVSPLDSAVSQLASPLSIHKRRDFHLLLICFFYSIAYPTLFRAWLNRSSPSPRNFLLLSESLEGHSPRNGQRSFYTIYLKLCCRCYSSLEYLDKVIPRLVLFSLTHARVDLSL